MNSELVRPLPVVYVSPRFLKAVYRGPLILQKAEQAFDDLLRRYISQPFQMIGYDRVAGLERHGVYEIKISGGERMLVCWAGSELTLLDVGEHEIVSRYTAAKYLHDIESREGAPRRFVVPGGGGFQEHVDADPTGKFTDVENQAGWSIHLDDEQSSVLARVMQSWLDRESTAHVILGGPGTGKTAVLGSLLNFFMDEDVDVVLSSLPLVREYLEMCWLRELDGRVGTAWSSSDIVLLDDPSTSFELRAALRQVRSGSTRLLVVGVDPLQLQDTLSDEELSGIFSEFGAQVHWLRSCYRQKENIGAEVARVLSAIAQSTPFASEGEAIDYRAQRSELSHKLNSLYFLNPGGYVRVIDDVAPSVVAREVSRLCDAAPLWTHWPNLLVVADQELPPALRETLTAPGLIMHEIPLIESESVKGADFQHAFIFVQREKFDALIQGSRLGSESDLTRDRLLRIPLTRAKDSLVFFLL